MNSIEQILSNLDQRQSFDLAIDFVLRKVSKGIRGYSVKEMQNLGKIANLINKQDKIKFHDRKILYFNEQLVLAFHKVLKESKSADGLKEVLAYYPIPVLNGIIAEYPQSSIILKIRDYLSYAENARKENKNFSSSQQESVSSSKAIVAKVDPDKLNQEKEIADELDEKIKQVGLNRLQKIMDKLIAKKQELESKMEEITERLGPFIRSDYSPHDIQEWLEGLSDDGLVSMDGIEMDQAVKYVQNYTNLNPIKFIFKDEVTQENTDITPEANSFRLDKEKEENRIQKVIQTDLKNIQKQILEVSESVDIIKNMQDTQILEEVAFVTEEKLDVIQQVTEAEEILEDIPEIAKSIDADHYNQGDVVSKLKDKHKKGMSI